MNVWVDDRIYAKAKLIREKNPFVYSSVRSIVNKVLYDHLDEYLIKNKYEESDLSVIKRRKKHTKRNR